MFLDDFEHILSHLLKINYDLLLLDIKIPYYNGTFLLKELRKEKNVPVIMLTSMNNEIDEMMSMSYGADDYITKPYHPSLLLLRIEALLRRTYHALQTVLFYNNISLNLAKSCLESKDNSIPLSKNELQIFYCLLQRRGTIVSRDDLMDELWNQEEFMDDNTLTVNIKRLRMKLEAIGLKDVIETRRGQGYLLK